MPLGGAVTIGGGGGTLTAMGTPMAGTLLIPA